MNEPGWPRLFRVRRAHPRSAEPRCRACCEPFAARLRDLQQRLQRVDSSRTSAAPSLQAAIVAGLEERVAIAAGYVREDRARRDRCYVLRCGDRASHEQQRTDLAMSLARILRRTQRYRCVDCGFASASHVGNAWLPRLGCVRRPRCSTGAGMQGDRHHSFRTSINPTNASCGSSCGRRTR